MTASPRTCILDFTSGTARYRQVLKWNGERYTLEAVEAPAPPEGPWQFWRMRIETEIGAFEIHGTDVEWSCAKAKKDELHRPDDVRSGRLQSIGAPEHVRLWVRVPTPLVPYPPDTHVPPLADRRSGDYVLVLVRLHNTILKYPSPLSIAAVCERDDSESLYMTWNPPAPGRDVNEVQLPATGNADAGWGADSAFEQAFGARPSGGLRAWWKPTGTPRPTYRLHLARTFVGVPGSDDPSLASAASVVWEQRPNPAGVETPGEPAWQLQPVAFPEPETHARVASLAWRRLTRSLYGQPESERTFLFDLAPESMTSGWLPAYDLVVPARAPSGRLRFRFVERLPTWAAGLASWLEFPALRDWRGVALRVHAMVGMAADESGRCTATIDNVRLEQAKGVRAGALDLRLGGAASLGAKCSFDLRRVPESRFGHFVERLRLVGFEIGTDGASLRLPLVAITPGGFDRDERRAERRDRPPLLLVSPEATPRATDAVAVAELVIAESRSVDGERSLDLRLRDRRPQQTEDTTIRLLVLDRNPFTVGMVRMPDILSFRREGGDEIAYWTDRDLFAGWQMRAAADGFRLVLPPQGVGEAMEKNRTGDGRVDIQPDRPVDFLFTPPSVLDLEASELPRNYAGTPWNLRLLLGEPRGDRLTGLPLRAARIELLYGLTAHLDGLPWLRVGELLARLGEPREVLPGSRARQDEFDGSVPAEFRWSVELGADEPKKTVWGDLGYSRLRNTWRHSLEAIAARLGVYEVFDDRQVEFSATGEPIGLQLAGQRGAVGLRYELRPSARFANPIADGKRVTDASQDPVPPVSASGLAGGFAWAFESQLVWEALWRERVADAVPFVAGTLQRLFLTALGGSGTQQASFDEGRTIIAARVELGRVVELRIERIGRIAVFWNRAKLVTVFTRSMVPSAQFGDQQDALVGRFVLRKTEEYVELIERKRAFPDAGAAPDQSLQAGCVVACSCEQRILVDARWGRDVRAASAQGWLVPLRVPFAPASIYGTVDMVLHFHADPQSGLAETTARIENATDLHFWSDTGPGRGSDTDRWPAVEDVDCGRFGRLDVGTVDDTGAPAVVPRAARFTWRLAGLQRAVNLAGHLPPDGNAEVAQLGAMLRSVTMARGSVEAAEPSRVEASFVAFQAECENALAVAEQVVAANGRAASLLGRDLWNELRDRLTSAGGPLARAQGILAELPATLPAAAELLRQFEQRLLANVRGAVRQAQDAAVEFAHRVPAELWSPFQAVRDAIDKGIGVPDAIAAAADRLQIVWRRGVEAIEGLQSSALRHVAAAIDAGEPLATAIGQLTEFDDAATLRERIEAIRVAARRIAAELDAIRWFAELRLLARPRDILLPLQRLADAIAVADLPQLRKRALAVRQAAEQQIRSLQQRLETAEEALLDAIGGVADPLAELHAEAQQALAAVATAAAPRDQLRLAWNLLNADLPQRVIDAFATLPDELAELVRAQIGEWLGDAQTMLDELVQRGRDMLQALRDQLPDLADLEGRVAEWTEWLQRRREDVAGLLHTVPSVVHDVLAARDTVLQVPRQTLSLFRAFGQVPRAVGLDFEEVTKVGGQLGQRLRSIGYSFDALARRVDFTPVLAAVDRARDAAGDLLQEARLKAASLQMPVRAFQQRLLSDAEALAKRALGNLLPDLGGLKLERLLGGVVGDDLAARIGAATKVRHSLDRQTMTASVEATIDDLALGRDAKLFGLGPVAFTLRRPRLQARLSVAVRPGEPVRRQSSGRITADWEMAVGGRPLLTFRSATLRCDDGVIRMELDPARLELDGLLRSLSDLMRSVRAGDDAFGAGLDADLPRRIIGYCRLNMGLPPLQAGAFAITNLNFGAFMEVGVELQPNADFLLRTGCNVARREAPFAIVVFVLGGCGWFTLKADYRVPLAGGPSDLVVRVDAGIGVAASIGINLGFASGSIFASLSLEVRCTVENHRSHWGMGVVLTFGGRVRVLGIIDVSLLVVLAVRYETGGGLTGEGRITISIRICWFIKIKIDAGFTYRFGRAATHGAPAAAPAAKLAAPKPGAAVALPAPPAAAAVKAPTAAATPPPLAVPRPERRQQIRRAAAMNA